ncbi:MAG: hypothetical protein NQ127_04300, partial [Candidatus Cardinium sp.]|nr:hypothetical protein [Candidatus Cardinium sp.]
MIHNLERKGWATPLWYVSLLALSGRCGQTNKPYKKSTSHTLSLPTEIPSTTKGINTPPSSLPTIPYGDRKKEISGGDRKVEESITRNILSLLNSTHVDHATTPIPNSTNTHSLPSSSTEQITQPTSVTQHGSASGSSFSWINLKTWLPKLVTGNNNRNPKPEDKKAHKETYNPYTDFEKEEWFQKLVSGNNNTRNPKPEDKKAHKKENKPSYDEEYSFLTEDED